MSARLRLTRLRVAVGALTLAVAAVVVVVVVAVDGSSGPTKREYAVPETLCGLEVERDLYAPLFPPGSALSQPERFLALTGLAMGERCAFELDGELIVWVSTSGSNSVRQYVGGMDAWGENGVPLDYDMADGTPVEGEFEAMVWPGLAVATTPCPPGLIISDFTVGIQTEYPEDEAESVRVLSALIQPLMRAAVNASQCEPGSHG